MSIQSLGHIGIRQETVFGEENLSAHQAFDEILEDTMKMDNNLISPNFVNGRRFQTNMIPGNITASGDILLNIKPEGAVPRLLKGLFGQAASREIADGVFEHTFTPAHTTILPSFSVESGWGDAENSQTWLGCTLSTAMIHIVRGDLLLLDVSLLSQRPKETAAPAQPVFTALPPWAGHRVSFTFNGEPDVRFENFSLQIFNNVQPVHKLNGKRWCAKHGAGEFQTGGLITLEFETEAERRRMWGSLTAVGPELTLAPCSLRMEAVHPMEVAPGHNYSLSIDMPEIYIQSAPANITRENDRILQEILFLPYFNRRTGKLIDAVLKNGESDC